jgi:hypothetical protein
LQPAAPDQPVVRAVPQMKNLILEQSPRAACG